MKLKLSQLVLSAPALQRLNAQPVKARIAFTLGKISRLIDPELKAYDEARVKLLKELGIVSDADPQRYELGDNAEKFVAELNDLLAQEVEIDFRPVPFADIEKVEISAADVLALDWLITDGEEVAK